MMDEQIKARLKSFLDAIESQAAKAGQFVIEQTPLVAQEYLAWYFWFSVLGAVCTLAAAIVGVAMWRRSSQGGDLGKAAVLFGFGSMLAVAGIVGTGYFAFRVVKVSVAPRVVLLEKVADMADLK